MSARHQSAQQQEVSKAFTTEVEALPGRHRPLTCHPLDLNMLSPATCAASATLSTCRLASRWKEYMAFLCSFYVADDI